MTLLAIEAKVVALFVDMTRENARSIARRVADDFRAGGFDVVERPARRKCSTHHYCRR